ncbi:hypothetical protein RLEG3_03635 (plasmid) [Rhizobium leguminosarum bv. trifolii WSM1689]|uniref:hypothetical protein n=1 Tax=Rhizobium leguminosarum TaxID=384 RepID=UPI0003E08B3D|nr:hypothetical protein [Rhizobium leguminosarum]AHF88195.1 hypothetical protein RLEG3_03635 [Rhizobium leguminosarum bv. trifolii WSM1689]
MQRSLIEPSRTYVSSNAKRPRCVSRTESGVVPTVGFPFGIAFSRTETLDEPAKWAHEDAELIERCEISEPLRT